MNLCECGCGALVAGVWSKGHNRRGVPPTNKKGSFYVEFGRAWLYRPNHPRARANGYVKRAWIIAEQSIGRPLFTGEDVHHKNDDKLDDHPENLEVLSHAAHARLHSTVTETCQECGGPHRARGLCSRCYGKYSRQRRPMPLPPSRGSRWTRLKQGGLIPCG